MLLSTVITLNPTEAITLSTDQGRAVQAWFLAQVVRHDAALAQAVHDAVEVKPFTCSSLRGFRPTHNGHGRQLTPGEPGWIRITTLSRELSAVMQERLLPELPEGLPLGKTTLDIAEATTDPARHPWAGVTTHTALLQEHLLSTERPDRRIGLRFATPTTFRRQKLHLPVPLPELTVQGWVKRWNGFAEVALPEELSQYAAECVAISAYNLRTLPVRFGKELTIGCVGRCTYHAVHPDPYYLRLMHLLAHYSFYCGTGHRTTRGLGQTRKL